MKKKKKQRVWERKGRKREIIIAELLLEKYKFNLTGISISSMAERQANLSEDCGLQPSNIFVNACRIPLL